MTRRTATRRTAYRLVAGAVMAWCVGVSVAIGAWLWSAPTGTGEYRDSPDERYTAHADNMSTRTLLGHREWRIELRVVEKRSGREVWRVVHRHADGAAVPDYGSRGERFITWAPDSSSVTVPVADGRHMVLAVP